MLTKINDGKFEDSKGTIYRYISDSDSADYSSGHDSWSVEGNPQKCLEPKVKEENCDQESNWESEICDLENPNLSTKKNIPTRFPLNEDEEDLHDAKVYPVVIRTPQTTSSDSDTADYSSAKNMCVKSSKKFLRTKLALSSIYF